MLILGLAVSKASSGMKSKSSVRLDSLACFDTPHPHPRPARYPERRNASLACVFFVLSLTIFSRGSK